MELAITLSWEQIEGYPGPYMVGKSLHGCEKIQARQMRDEECDKCIPSKGQALKSLVLGFVRVCVCAC